MSIKRGSIVFFLPLIIVLNRFSSDQSGWVLRKNKNGIAVYTKYTIGSNIKEIWMVDTVKSSLSAIVALLLDTKNYPKWVYHCGQAKTLQLINDQEEYDYELTTVPWPFNNRDLIDDSKISQDSLTKTVVVESSAAPEYMPPTKNVVRISHYHSIYKLTKLENSKVRIDYTGYGDPGGDIPAWLINANIVVGPYNTALGMNKRLPLYQSATYPFIKE